MVGSSQSREHRAFQQPPEMCCHGRKGGSRSTTHPGYPPPRDALEGKRSQRRPQERLGRRLEEVAKAVGGGYCRLQMPLRLALGVRETVAGHRLGALEVGPQAGQQSAPHMHVLVCICSNVRQFH